MSEVLPPIQFTPAYAEAVASENVRIFMEHGRPDYLRLSVRRSALVELPAIAQGLTAQERAEATGQRPAFVTRNRGDLLNSFWSKGVTQLVQTGFRLGALVVPSDEWPIEALTPDELRALQQGADELAPDGTLMRIERNGGTLSRDIFGKLRVPNGPAAITVAYMNKLEGFTDPSIWIAPGE